VLITWPPGQGRQVVLFRAEELLGRYQTEDGSNPYVARSGLNSNGFAQGSLVPVAGPDGEDVWHGMFFRDTFPIGRIPALIPATWSDGWPTFGDDGVVPVGGAFPRPITLSDAELRLEQQKSIVASDDFDNDARTARGWTRSGRSPRRRTSTSRSSAPSCSSTPGSRTVRPAGRSTARPGSP